MQDEQQTNDAVVEPTEAPAAAAPLQQLRPPKLRRLRLPLRRRSGPRVAVRVAAVVAVVAVVAMAVVAVAVAVVTIAADAVAMTTVARS